MHHFERYWFKRYSQEFKYYPANPTKCKCRPSKRIINCDASCNQEDEKTEEDSAEFLAHGEGACNHSRTTKEINNQNSVLKEAVMTKIKIAAEADVSDIERKEYTVQLMALVGTHWCYNAARISYLDLNKDGHKMKMVKSLITSLSIREKMHKEEREVASKLWQAQVMARYRTVCQN